MSDNKLTTNDFQELDALDERQIIAELQGAVLDEYVYSFRSGGKQVTGLSWAGVKAIANKMGGISTDLVQVLETPESYAVICKSIYNGVSRLGAAEQAKNIVTRNGEVLTDTFALTKAVSKAQRNAIRAHIPEDEILAMIKNPPRQAGTAPAPAKPTNGGKVSSDPTTVFWSEVKARGVDKVAAQAVYEEFGPEIGVTKLGQVK